MNNNNDFNNDPYLNDNITLPCNVITRINRPKPILPTIPQYLNPLLKSPDSLESGPSKLNQP